MYWSKLLQIEFSAALQTEFGSYHNLRYQLHPPVLKAFGLKVALPQDKTTKVEFVADKVLAKHDENYMPPEVAESLAKHAKAKAAAEAARQAQP